MDSTSAPVYTNGTANPITGELDGYYGDFYSSTTVLYSYCTV